MAIPSLPLLDGRSIPALGFGSPAVDPDRGVELYLEALEAGWRLIDTAASYGNEDVVGRAVAQTAVPRDEIQVSTKIQGKDHGYDSTLAAFERSRETLGLDYVDYYLIHWPNPGYDKYVDTWRAMIDLRESGVVRSIGVCNFTDEFLARLIDETGVAPVVNQIERHPLFPNEEMVRRNQARGIITQSWSALGRGHSFLDSPVLGQIAAAYDRTPGQIVLRWHVQGDSLPLSYTTRPERLRQNLDVFDFELSDTDMAAISAMEAGRIWDMDPALCNFL